MRGVLLQSENSTSEGSEMPVGTEGIMPEGLQNVLLGDVLQLAVDLTLAAIVVAIGWYLSKLVVRVAGRTVARRIERPSVTRTVLRGVRVSILVMTGVAVLSIFGLGGGQILLQVTVISAVIAVVLAPLVGSLINGVFVIADQPYEIGDMIEIADVGHKGFVEDITIRYTKIFTLQNTFIVIPNSAIQERDVINYSAEDERTRISVSFEVTYGSDLEVARQQAERAARTADTVISGGPDIRIGSARYRAAPLCTIEKYADNGVILELRFWVEHPYKQVVARSDVQAAIRNRYADRDVEFAYPRRHHVFDRTSGAARVAVDGPESEWLNGGPTDVPGASADERRDGLETEAGTEGGDQGDQ